MQSAKSTTEVPMPDSRHKRINAPSVKSLVVDKERLRASQWLGLVLFVLLPFSALML